MNPIKMHTEGGKWYIEDQKKTIEFDDINAAWLYISYITLIRATVKIKSKIASTNIHPVRSLVPHPIKGL